MNADEPMRSDPSHSQPEMLEQSQNPSVDPLGDKTTPQFPTSRPSSRSQFVPLKPPSSTLPAPPSLLYTHQNFSTTFSTKPPGESSFVPTIADETNFGTVERKLDSISEKNSNERMKQLHMNDAISEKSVQSQRSNALEAPRYMPPKITSAASSVSNFHTPSINGSVGGEVVIFEDQEYDSLSMVESYASEKHEEDNVNMIDTEHNRLFPSKFSTSTSTVYTTTSQQLVQDETDKAINALTNTIRSIVKSDIPVNERSKRISQAVNIIGKLDGSNNTSVIEAIHRLSNQFTTTKQINSSRSETSATSKVDVLEDLLAELDIAIKDMTPGDGTLQRFAKSGAPTQALPPNPSSSSLASNPGYSDRQNGNFHKSLSNLSSEVATSDTSKTIFFEQQQHLPPQQFSQQYQHQPIVQQPNEPQQQQPQQQRFLVHRPKTSEDYSNSSMTPTQSHQSPNIQTQFSAAGYSLSPKNQFIPPLPAQSPQSSTTQPVEEDETGVNTMEHESKSDDNESESNNNVSKKALAMMGVQNEEELQKIQWSNMKAFKKLGLDKEDGGASESEREPLGPTVEMLTNSSYVYCEYLSVPIINKLYIKTHKKMFCVLVEGMLYYFKSNDPFEQAVGSIPITGDQITPALDGLGRKIIEIKSTINSKRKGASRKTWELHVETEEDQRTWVRMLKRAIPGTPAFKSKKNSEKEPQEPEAPKMQRSLSTNQVSNMLSMSSPPPLPFSPTSRSASSNGNPLELIFGSTYPLPQQFKTSNESTKRPPVRSNSAGAADSLAERRLMYRRDESVENLVNKTYNPLTQPFSPPSSVGRKSIDQESPWQSQPQYSYPEPPLPTSKQYAPTVGSNRLPRMNVMSGMDSNAFNNANVKLNSSSPQNNLESSFNSNSRQTYQSTVNGQVYTGRTTQWIANTATVQSEFTSPKANNTNVVNAYNKPQIMHIPPRKNSNVTPMSPNAIPPSPSFSADLFASSIYSSDVQSDIYRQSSNYDSIQRYPSQKSASGRVYRKPLDVALAALDDLESNLSREPRNNY
ncbi:hypothetical protein HK098_008275 [Nowakowskiella sp. JEL0407]|nr:hypothetical protein HK098_008275 [Nowakowskiella sp. JEL0407]